MFAFSTPLFWYKLVFMTELLLAEGLATYTLKKRGSFALRAALSVLAVYAVTFLLPVLPNNAVYTSFMFLLMFAFTMAAMKILYDEPWLNLVFCGIVAYTAQHIAYEIYGFITNAFGLGYSGFVYGGDAPEKSYDIFTGIAYFCSYFLVYWLIWAFIERRIRLQEDLSLEHLPLFVFVVVIVAVDIVLSIVVTYLPAHADSKAYLLIIGLYNILSCSLALGMQFSMLGKKLAQKELETVQSLWNQDKKAYELSKENVELINVKCHDLKKQIRALRTAVGEVDKAALKEIEQAVNIYDGAVKTGSDVLDVVLAEKSLYCEKHGIKLTCIADGEKLNFLPATEVYSLFENAVQNAVEAVGKIRDIDRRMIRLKTSTVGRMLSLHVENCVDKAPEFVGGLPKTTKGDARYHGYGVRSMQMIAEKYGGGLTASVEDGLFNLDVVIPLPDQLGKTEV